MKKNVILVMLLLAGAVSVTGQEISEDPIMVVTGNVVNTGVLIAKGPIDLRANTEKNSKIDNTATGNIQTPALTVGSDTQLNNEGNICIGCVLTPAWPADLLLTGAARDYEDGTSGDVAKKWKDAKNDEYSGYYYAGGLTGLIPATGKDLWVSEFVYSGDTQVSSKGKSEGSAPYADLSPLETGIDWASAVKKCADLVEGGHEDWYLPNMIELDALAKAGYLGGQYIKGTEQTLYWSSTEFDEDTANTWIYYVPLPFLNGYLSRLNKSNTITASRLFLARCVRRN